MDISDQLRVRFTQPSKPVTMHLILAGAHVLVETDPDWENEAWSYLAAAGANPTMGHGKGLSFPAKHLPALADLPLRCAPAHWVSHPARRRGGP